MVVLAGCRNDSCFGSDGFALVVVSQYAVYMSDFGEGYLPVFWNDYGSFIDFDATWDIYDVCGTRVSASRFHELDTQVLVFRCTEFNRYDGLPFATDILWMEIAESNIDMDFPSIIEPVTMRGFVSFNGDEMLLRPIGIGMPMLVANGLDFLFLAHGDYAEVTFYGMEPYQRRGVQGRVYDVISVQARENPWQSQLRRPPSGAR